MKRFVSALMGAVALLFLAAGCSRVHTAVILMPDPDGHVGKAVVISDGGSQLLAKSHAMTTVSTASAAPTPATEASSDFIAATFADVMAIEPPPAEKFILYFHTSSTHLVSDSDVLIPTILGAIRRRSAVKITVSGHTDASGSTALNEVLARDRANAIRDILVAEGVAPERITVTSHGKGNQLVPTADGVSQPRNRRVEVIVR